MQHPHHQEAHLHHASGDDLAILTAIYFLIASRLHVVSNGVKWCQMVHKLISIWVANVTVQKAASCKQKDLVSVP